MRTSWLILRPSPSGVTLQFFSIEPAKPLHVTLKRGDAVLFDRARDGRSAKRQSRFRGFPTVMAANRWS